jgi:hypothetical protein
MEKEVEDAIKKLNHFSEKMLTWKDEINEWKGGVSATLKLVMWFSGGTFLVLAAAFVKDLLGG